MNEQAGLNARTTLEYLVLLNEQSYLQIDQIIDTVLDEIEAGNLEKLSRMTH